MSKRKDSKNPEINENPEITDHRQTDEHQSVPTERCQPVDAGGGSDDECADCGSARDDAAGASGSRSMADYETDSTKDTQDDSPSPAPKRATPPPFPPAVTDTCCSHKGLWLAHLTTVVLCLGLAVLSYTLMRKQNEIRGQLNTRVTVAEVAREVAVTVDPMVRRLNALDTRMAPLQERVDALDSSVASVLGNQQNSAHAISRFDQAIVRLKNEQRDISVRLHEMRQEAVAPAQSEQIRNIIALIGMAEDQLALNHNPVQARMLLGVVSERLVRQSDPGLLFLNEALRHDLALLEPAARLDRTDILGRLTALEPRFVAALQSKSAPVISTLPDRSFQSPGVPAAAPDSTSPDAASITRSEPLAHPDPTDPGSFVAATAQGWGDQIHVAWNHVTRFLGDYIRIQRNQPRREPLPEVVDVAELQLEFRQWLGIARVALFTQEYDAFGQAVDAIAQLLADHTDLDQSGLRDDYDALMVIRALPSQIPSVSALRSGPAARSLFESLPATAEQLPSGETE